MAAHVPTNKPDSELTRYNEVQRALRGHPVEKEIADAMVMVARLGINPSPAEPNMSGLAHLSDEEKEKRYAADVAYRTALLCMGIPKWRLAQERLVVAQQLVDAGVQDTNLPEMRKLHELYADKLESALISISGRSGGTDHFKREVREADQQLKFSIENVQKAIGTYTNFISLGPKAAHHWS